MTRLRFFLCERAVVLWGWASVCALWYLAIEPGRSCTWRAEELDTSVTTVKLWGRSFKWAEGLRSVLASMADSVPRNGRSAGSPGRRPRGREVRGFAIPKPKMAVLGSLGECKSASHNRHYANRLECRHCFKPRKLRRNRSTVKRRVGVRVVRSHQGNLLYYK